MKKTMNTLYLIKVVILIMTISFFASCGKTCTNNYHFEFPIKMYPEQDTFKMGDTIFLEVAFTPNSLLNLENNTTVNSGDFDFELYLIIGKYDSTSVTDGLHDFAFGAQFGTVNKIQLPTISRLTFEVESLDDKKVIRYFVIPQSSGYFHFSFVSESAPYKDPIEFLDSKCEEYLTVDFNLNEKTENNFDHYKNNSIDEDATLEGVRRTGFYAFVVME